MNFYFKRLSYSIKLDLQNLRLELKPITFPAIGFGSMDLLLVGRVLGNQIFFFKSNKFLICFDQGGVQMSPIIGEDRVIIFLSFKKFYKYVFQFDFI